MKTILAVTLALVAATASANSYVIERIDVNAAKRIPAAAVVAETRLDAGKTYTTEQLEQAVSRVRRLPFVLYATADLLPGSTPGARVLRIDIEEMANFNWAFDTAALARQRGGGEARVTGDVGYRFFPGRHGMLDAVLGDSNESFVANTRRDATIAYNAWGLFGTRAYGNVAIGTLFRTNGRHDLNPSALLGVPLTRTQSIEATFGRTTSRLERSVSGIADPLRSFSRVTDYGVAWLLQTADDPYFARTGFDAGAGPSWVRNELDLPFVLTFPKPPHVVPGRQSQRELVLSANAAKYWPLRQASTAWARVAMATTRVTGTANGVAFPNARQNAGDFLVGLAHDFNREIGESGQRRWRFEAGAGYHLDRLSGRNVRPRSGTELEIGTAYRNRFGLFHLTFGYVGH